MWENMPSTPPPFFLPLDFFFRFYGPSNLDFVCFQTFLCRLSFRESPVGLTHGPHPAKKAEGGGGGGGNCLAIYHNQEGKEKAHHRCRQRPKSFSQTPFFERKKVGKEERARPKYKIDSRGEKKEKSLT